MLDLIVTTVLGVLGETWTLLLEMAPYLMLGFLIAGLLHAYMPQTIIAKHLSGQRASSVTKASLLGIPLPLCSCGVLPVAAHLKKNGAGRGPVLSFLISTPTTGPDSILATYALLGPLLAIMRPIAAFINGVATGLMAIVLDKRGDVVKNTVIDQSSDTTETIQKTIVEKLTGGLKYAFVDLVDDVGKWVVIGIFAGGVISYVIPGDAIAQYASNPLIAYPAVLLAGLPMYVCATGSIPIAAALMMKGLTPGGAFIFLFAGPATNAAAMTFVSGTMGKRDTVLYVTSILVFSVIFGLLVDWIWQYLDGTGVFTHAHDTHLPPWLSISTSIILLGLLLRGMMTQRDSTPAIENKTPDTELTVAGMSCHGCVQNVKDAVVALDDVEAFECDLNSGRVSIYGSVAEDQIKTAIEQAGYRIIEKG